MAGAAPDDSATAKIAGLKAKYARIGNACTSRRFANACAELLGLHKYGVIALDSLNDDACLQFLGGPHHDRLLDMVAESGGELSVDRVEEALRKGAYNQYVVLAPPGTAAALKAHVSWCKQPPKGRIVAYGKGRSEGKVFLTAEIEEDGEVRWVTTLIGGHIYNSRDVAREVRFALAAAVGEHHVNAAGAGGQGVVDEDAVRISYLEWHMHDRNIRDARTIHRASHSGFARASGAASNLRSLGGHALRRAFHGGVGPVGVRAMVPRGLFVGAGYSGIDAANTEKNITSINFAGYLRSKGLAGGISDLMVCVDEGAFSTGPTAQRTPGNTVSNLAAVVLGQQLLGLGKHDTLSVDAFIDESQQARDARTIHRASHSGFARASGAASNLRSLSGHALRRAFHGGVGPVGVRAMVPRGLFVGAGYSGIDATNTEKNITSINFAGYLRSKGLAGCGVSDLMVCVDEGAFSTRARARRTPGYTVSNLAAVVLGQQLIPMRKE